MKRKHFIQKVSKSAIGAGFLPFAAGFVPDFTSPLPSIRQSEPEKDEAFWAEIRKRFMPSHDFINLEYGYFSPAAVPTTDYCQERNVYIQSNASYFMRNEQTDSLENARTALSNFLQVSPAELAITRNTTESLNTVISGFPWKPKEEVIIGNQDYGSMVAAFEQAASRHGIVIKVAQVPLHPQSETEIVQAYVSLINKRTKMVHLTHLINLTGQIIPVAKIAEKCREKGIVVVVDAAHSIAHVNFKLPDLKADIVAASLHKWLCNPLGAGFLWVHQNWIPKIWPLMADKDYATTDIRKFEHQGTRPIQTIESIAKAIQFHNGIGAALKEKRLHYLKTLVLERAAKLDLISLTPAAIHQSVAISTVASNKLSPIELKQKFWQNNKVFTVAIDHAVVKGVRITPHIYSTPQEIEKLQI